MRKGLTFIKNIPKFPSFTKLSLDHRDTLYAIANDFPSSDFNFAGLFTWDVDEVVTVSSLNDNLVICSSDYLTHTKFYSFIGSNKVDETVKTLIHYAKDRGAETNLRLITQSVAQHINSDLYEIEEDRDNHDYILSVKDLVEFKSNKYRGKKNLHNRFLGAYGENVKEEELDLNNPSVRQDIEKVLLGWQQSRNKTADEVKDEFMAIRKALDHHKLLEVRAFGVYHDGQLIAFSLFEIVPGKVAIIHFDKANVEFEGIFEHLKHSFARHLWTLGITSINYEQDLGIEGLRRAKESYHPVEYIKKYIIKQK